MKMKKSQWGPLTLAVDATTTRDWNNQRARECTCESCTFFAEQMLVHEELLSLLQPLGIDLSNPSHLSEFETDNEELRHFIVSYHVNGSLVEGVFSDEDEWSDASTFSGNTFTLGCAKNMEFIPEGAPECVLQIDVEVIIPVRSK